MLSCVVEGWSAAGGGPVEMLNLSRRADFERSITAFGDTDVVLLGMPLYTDVMPALVKEWIEALESRVGRDDNPTMAFLVQSGFLEALHSRHLECYLEKLSQRLGAPYAGTVIKGMGEALQSMPDQANRKLWDRLRSLGGQLATVAAFDPETLGQVAGVERLSPLAAAAAGVALKMPVAQFQWTGQLKKSGAWDRRFDAPYANRP
jgi:hypothetical protein